MRRLGAVHRARGASCKRNSTLSLVSLQRGGNLLWEWVFHLFCVTEYLLLVSLAKFISQFMEAVVFKGTT